MDKQQELTGAEMLEYRTRALSASVATHGGKAEPAQIAHTAGVFLGFLLSGMPVEPIGAKVTTTGAPPAAPPQAATAPAAAAATKAATTRAAPAAATGAAPAAAAKSAATIAAPTTMADAVKSFKALVADKAEGRGRDVAIALLTEFGVEQLSQVPAPKLAEFKARCDSAGKTPGAATGGTQTDDPTGGLL